MTDRRERVRAMIDEVINAHDPAALRRFTAVPEIEGAVRSLLDAFPDLHFDVSWSVAEGDRVIAFIEMSGTHEGPWLMVREPTHRPMRASLMLGCLSPRTARSSTRGWAPNFIAMLAQLGWGVAPVGSTVPDPLP